jgi:5-methylcytosine-specific restriction enzyme A
MPNLPSVFRPAHLGARRASERKRQADLSARRGPRLEDKAWWQRQRRLFLASNPLCCCCKANGVIKAASLVDHIEPHGNVDGPLFRDPDNWQPLCNWCHEHVKKPLEHLVAAGKATKEELRLARPFPEHFST